jgi:hypothetical protein
MALPALIPLLAPLLGDIVKKVIPDKNLAEKIERETTLALIEQSDSLTQIQGQIVLAEAKSDSWITSSWRPLLMMVSVMIIAINFLFIPVVAMAFPAVVTNTVDFPNQLWTLLQIGVGGYIVGRSGEKIVKNWEQSK